MKAKPSKKSGFVEGRSKSGPSRSAKKSDIYTKTERKRLDNLDRAKDDLLDVLGKPVTIVKSAKIDNAMRGKKAKHEDLDLDEDDDEEFSLFEQEIKKLRKIVAVENKEEYNAEASSKLMKRAMLSTILDIIPIAEKTFRKTKKEQHGYVLNAMFAQAREIETELRMVGNVENQAAFIRDSIITPMFNAILQNMMQAFMTFNSTIDTEVSSLKTGKRLKRSNNEALKTLGRFLNDAMNKVNGDVTSYLSGDMSFNKAPKSSRRKKKHD